jgi:hypothetical protein
VPVWYVAPLEMNEGTHWGQGYNRLTVAVPKKGPIKRHLTFSLRWEQILKLIFKMWNRGHGLDSSGSVGYGEVAGSFECGNEPSDSIQMRGIS